MQLNQCSPQYAKDHKFFYPVWHGTTQNAHQLIKEQGFKVTIGEAMSGNTRCGYSNENYRGFDFPAPVHHLGYGVYFATAYSVAKIFNNNSVKGLIPFALDIPKLDTINFAIQKTMMNWWISNGYNPELAKTNRVEATKIMTDTLNHKFDAVWFRGKGLKGSLLDGDQLCVYDPDRIYAINNDLAKGFEVGAKVIRKSDGITGIIINSEDYSEFDPIIFEKYHAWKGIDRYYLTVSWKGEKKATSIADTQVTPISSRRITNPVTMPIRKVNLRRKHYGKTT